MPLFRKIKMAWEQECEKFYDPSMLEIFHPSKHIPIATSLYDDNVLSMDQVGLLTTSPQTHFKNSRPKARTLYISNMEDEQLHRQA